jgi:zinc protease
MILVGDFDPKQVIALARSHFEGIPPQPQPEPIRTKEPEQLGERRVSIIAEAQTPLLQFAYHGMSGADARKPALELLARILTDGDASRLHRVLVEEQKLAISADSYIEAGFDPGTVWFMLSLPAGGDLARAEAVFGAEIDKVIQSGVTAAELERARNQALASFWRGLTTIDGKAQALGTYAVLQGGHERLFTAPKAYESVTIEDIKKVASELLRPTNRTVGVLSAASATSGEEG